VKGKGTRRGVGEAGEEAEFLSRCLIISVMALASSCDAAEPVLIAAGRVDAP